MAPTEEYTNGGIMRPHQLNLFLALELFAVIWAGFVFSVLQSRLLAGALAGGYFVLSGLFMVGVALKWPKKWRSFLWYPLLIHVFVISIPMVGSRFWQWSQGFDQVQIFGLPGPIFHRLSTIVFGSLLLGTVIDRVRLGR
jgi:hypothetical protein